MRRLQEWNAAGAHLGTAHQGPGALGALPVASPTRSWQFGTHAPKCFVVLHLDTKRSGPRVHWLGHQILTHHRKGFSHNRKLHKIIILTIAHVLGSIMFIS